MTIENESYPARSGRTLRKRIETAIDSANGDSAAAAIAVLMLLDDELDLTENEWFENDEVMQKAILEAD